MPARAGRDWRALQWMDLLHRLPANALPAILDRPRDQLYDDARLCALERAALREARAVIHRLGLQLEPLPGPGARVPVWAICDLPPALSERALRRHLSKRSKISPLHADLRQGRTSQVLFINGAVSRAGEKLGIATPTNRALYETLHGIARGDLDWEPFRGRPSRILRLATPRDTPAKEAAYRAIRMSRRSQPSAASR